MSKIHVRPEHLRQTGGKVSGFGGKLAEGGQKLESAGQSLVAHAGGDRSGIGAVVAKLFGRGVQTTGKVFSEGGRVVEGAGKRLHTTADLYEEADGKGAGLLKKLHPDGKGKVDPPGGGTRAGTRVGSGGGQRARTARQHVGGSARSHAVPPTGRTTTKDPVDLATGEVLLTQTDLTLPGALPLVLTRTHVSSYRVGRSFGGSWASTLDQRLEVDEAGVVFVADDGTLLVYPTPLADATAVPAEEGPRKLLRRNNTGYEVSDELLGRRLRFDGGGVLTGIEDLAGHRITIDRRPDGTPTAIRHSGGYHVEIATEDGLVTELRVGGTSVMRFGYEDRDLVTVTNASDTPLRFAYDGEGRLTEWVDRNDMWYRYHYDAQGRCVFAEGADGQLNSTMEYDRENLVTRMTDSLGHVTSYHLNAADQVVRTVDPLGGETISEWDRYDRLLTRTDPLGRTTRFEYSEGGDVTRVTRPDGTQAVAEHNNLHLPVTVVAPDGAIWRREYDEVGNPVSVADPAGAVTRLGYDAQRHLASTTDALGAVTRFTCDAAGLPVTVTDPLGAVTRYDRDEFGRVTTITDPIGGVTRLMWTVDGRLAEQIQADGSRQSWRYDGEGNVTEHIDAAGQATRTEYGGFDVPVAQTDSTGARTVYGYDTELRLTSVTNPAGLTWTYDYDPAGNLVGETDFNGRTLTYNRDIAGQLVGTTNGLGQHTVHVLDVIGRVTEQRSAAGRTTFSYDPVGRLVRATNPDTELVLTRDPLGRVLAETCNGRTVASTYDLVGRKTGRLTPSGVRSRWQYDLAGRLEALEGSGRTLTFGYDPAGRESGRSMGAATLTQTWDDNHRLHTQALTAPGPVNPRLIQRRAYTYRRDGAVTAIVDQLAGPQQFDLDPLGRVTAVASGNGNEQYGYDASGNLTAANRSHTGTLLRTSGSVRYEHDAQGRVITRSSRTLSGQTRTWRYVWNDADRLIQVTTPDQVTWRYVYDALGRRTAKLRMATDGQAVVEQTWFAWDGTTLAEQTDAAGRSTSWDYRPGSHVPLAQTEQSEIDRRFYAIVTDLVGTPSELVDGDGAVVWRRSTTLWGAQLGGPAQAAYCPLRFPGQYHDPETGQHYNYFRYYDPEDGVYTSADPLGLAGGDNPHAYVPNPVSWSDPLGLAPYTAGSRTRFTVSPGSEVTDHIGNHNSVSLGRYPAYIEHAQATGSRTFNIGDAWNDMEGRKDKFGGSGDNSEIWIRNRQFLDQAVARHSEMLLADNPNSGLHEGSYFMREINYLKSRGYTVSPDGSRMIPPGGH